MLLKRGIAATIEEWSCPLNTFWRGGTTTVILCERGIGQFESYTLQHTGHLRDPRDHRS